MGARQSSLLAEMSEQSVERPLNPSWDLYKLPADLEEMDRLTLQHRIWMEIMQGLCPVPKSVLNEVLLSRGEDGPKPAILDLGSGSGVWAVEMAQVFPEARVVGFDLNQSKPENVPPNCEFMQGDWNAGLEEFKGAFDVVHVRSVIGHMNESKWDLAIQQAKECLRPGGILFLLDGHVYFLGEDKEPVTPASCYEDTDPTHSWSQRYFLEINDRVWNHRVAPSAHFKQWMEKSTDIVPESVGNGHYLVPMGWSGDGIKNGETIGKLMGMNFRTFAPAWRPLFLKSGVPEEELQLWISRVETEMNEGKPRVYGQFFASWGRCRHPNEL